MMGIQNVIRALHSSHKTNEELSADMLSKILQAKPETLSAFEEAYKKSNIDGDGVLGPNSRQAAAQKDKAPFSDDSIELQKRIVDELLAQTETLTFDGVSLRVCPASGPIDSTKKVTREEILAIPERERPQLTGYLMKVDIPDPSFPVLLSFYDRYLTAKTQREQTQAYHRFRQGLDILDLDPVTYKIIEKNRNSIGHWFPRLVEACDGSTFFKIPKTIIAKVPITLLQLAHTDFRELTPATLSIVDDWARHAFCLEKEQEYFIKTGTYSSKFDFRNAHVHGEKEVNELGEYLLYIHSQALQMAGPTCSPCIYGMSTTNEWVVREFIHDVEGNPCIYSGMPLHTEYRVFVDCDTDTILGMTPYWEPKTMENRFGKEGNVNSIHQKHDYVIFKAHSATLMERYEQNKDAVIAHVHELIPKLALQGQWSLDIMQNGNDFWLIDMATAETSYFYTVCVPETMRRPVKIEDWVPKLTD